MSLHALLGTVYSEHSRWLNDWFRRRTSSVEVAKDMVQDTFLKLLLDSASRSLENPKALLTVIARQVLIDRYRREGLETSYLDMLIQMPEPTLPSAEEQAVVREMLRQLDKILGDLSNEVRAAFLLSRLDGLGCEEIAAQLEISERTVKRYIAKAYEACITAQIMQHEYH